MNFDETETTTDLLAAINTQLFRVGWNDEQLKEHLVNTYDKTAKWQMTDEELYNLLKYLKGLSGKI